MLKRYGYKALEESAARADELVASDDNGAAVWRRILPPSSNSRTRLHPAWAPINSVIVAHGVTFIQAVDVRQFPGLVRPITPPLDRHDRPSSCSASAASDPRF